MSYFKGPEYEEAFPNFDRNISALNLLLDGLRRNGDSIAMVEGQTGKTATFRDLLQQSSCIAAGLRDAGVTAGDYVIICCDKSITAYSLLLGIIFTGATAVLYPSPHIDIVKKLTNGFPIKAVICDEHYSAPLKKSIGQLDVQPSLFVTTGPQNQVLSSLLNCKTPFCLYQVKDVDKHVPMIFFSSGTTGDPKGVQIRDLYVQHCGYCFDFGLKKFFVSSPMFWMSALMTFCSSIFGNFTAVWSNSTEPKDNLLLLQNYKVDGWFNGTGSMTRYINEPTLSKYDLSSVKRVLVGGEYVVSSIFNDFVTKVLKNSSVVVNGYGSTEGGFMAVTKLGQKFEIGCCGSLCPGVEYKVLDDDHKILPVGRVGELWLRNAILTPGYWGNPGATKEAFDSEGYFRTSDAGFFDKDGQLHMRGRVGDLITYRGVTVSPAEVEDILMSHEAVLDTAVVGKPHPTDGQQLTAYVVLNPGHNTTEAQLRDLVDKQVDDHMKLRGGVKCLPALPRTIIGKVQRKVLREM